MLFDFSATTLVQPPQELTQFVDGLLERLAQQKISFDGANRPQKRQVAALPVRAMPLDQDMRPCGDAFSATTRDLSLGGIALIHIHHIAAPFLAVELVDLAQESFASRRGGLRRRRVGLFFEIGGKFITKVYDPIRRR